MRRPFQYSLRTLMVLMLLVAAFFAGMAVQRRETEWMRMVADEMRAQAEAERDLALASEQRARLVAEHLYADELARANSFLEKPVSVESTDGQ